MGAWHYPLLHSRQSTPEFDVLKIKNAEYVKNLLSDLVEEERDKKRVSAREYMADDIDGFDDHDAEGDHE